jgi:hypothetical protein
LRTGGELAAELGEQRLVRLGEQLLFEALVALFVVLRDTPIDPVHPFLSLGRRLLLLTLLHRPRGSLACSA